MNIAGSSHLVEAEGYQRQYVPSPLQGPTRLFLRTVRMPVINACTGTDLQRLASDFCCENKKKKANKKRISHPGWNCLYPTKVRKCQEMQVVASDIEV